MKYEFQPLRYPLSLGIDIKKGMVNTFDEWKKCFPLLTEEHMKDSFWFKPVPESSEKDWEILSLINLADWIFVKEVNHIEPHFVHPKTGEIIPLHRLLDNDYKIHSVKRLSDGVVFTVGQDGIESFEITDVMSAHVVGRKIPYPINLLQKQSERPPLEVQTPEESFSVVRRHLLELISSGSPIPKMWRKQYNITAKQLVKSKLSK